MKLQAPSIKLQRSSKLKAAQSNQGNSASTVYSEPIATAWILQEGNGETRHRHPFDLLERTARFGEAIVRFSKKIPRNPTNNRLIDQLVGCGTSLGSNYIEANEGVSIKDFRFSISRCVKESKETKFFLRMVAASEPDLIEEGRQLYREAHEFLMIFVSMYRKGSKR